MGAVYIMKTIRIEIENTKDRKPKISYLTVEW